MLMSTVRSSVQMRPRKHHSSNNRSKILCLAEWPLIYTELRAEPLLSSAACESKVWRLSNFDEFLIPVPVSRIVCPAIVIIYSKPAFYRDVRVSDMRRFPRLPFFLMCTYVCMYANTHKYDISIPPHSFPTRLGKTIFYIENSIHKQHKYAYLAQY